MKSIGSVLFGIIKFILLLPFRILAFIGGFIIGAVGIIIQLATKMGTVVIGLFNLLLLLSFIGMVISNDYTTLKNLLILLGGEAVLLMIVGLASGILGVVRDILFEFAFGRPVAMNFDDI